MITEKETKILKTLDKSSEPMTATEIGKKNKLSAHNASAWAIGSLKPLVTDKYVARKEKKVKGSKRVSITYSLMAKGRKAVSK